MSTQISISPVIKLEVNTTPITGGSAGRILFQTTSNTVGESSNLFWDATNNRLGIGTSTPLSALGIVQTDAIITVRNTNATAYSGMNMYDDANNLVGSFAIGGTNASVPTLAGNMLIGARTATGRLLIVGGPSATTFATMFSTGNLAINTTTDAGFKLDINGTARVSGRFTIGSDIIPSGVGSSVVLAAHVAAGNILDLSYYTGSQTALSTTKNVVYSAITFNPTGGTAVFNQLNFAPTINQTGGANGITRGLYVNPTLTAAADFRAIETTAGNVLFSNGSLTISSSGPTFNMNVLNNSQISAIYMNATDGNPRGGLYTNINTGEVRLIAGTGGYFQTFYNSGSEVMRLISGNLLIGTTTNAGFRLDVNGTARVTGAMTIGNSVITGNFGNLTLSNNGIAGVVLTFTNNRWGTSDLAVFGTQGAHADASSQIEIRSTTRGFLPPRMTTTQKNAIATPATGLMVYDTDLNRPCFYNGSSWITL